MKIEIETYKGQTIFYDEDADKFVCDITIEDKNKNTKRQSLVDVRKEIDTFIKMNVDFIPFRAFKLDSYDKKSFKECFVSAIRSDGKFVISDDKDSKYKPHYDKEDMQNVMIYDKEIEIQKQRLEESFEAARVNYRKGIIKLCEQLKTVNLSAYEHIMNQQ